MHDYLELYESVEETVWKLDLIVSKPVCIECKVSMSITGVQLDYGLIDLQ